MAIDLGHLLRLKNMIDSTATTLEPSAAANWALTDSYTRVRQETLDLVAEDSDLTAEFTRLFPEMHASNFVPEPVTAMAMRHQLEQNARMDSEARRAVALLGQLAGWVQGLIDEQTLEQRLKLEAEARAHEEARRTGF